jgi:hypothetical protein
MRSKEYKNGWSAMMDKSGYLYTVIVRNARGDIHDKVRCDEYRSACEYYRIFNAIAKAA